MDPIEPFPDNWAYLRTELSWLDRLLGTAIARQRKEVKEVERVARSQADKATSHWWKGLISVEGEVAGDSPADTARRRSTGKTSYQQQMDDRIRVTAEKGIHLGLPALCQKLKLTSFEKTLVLMALAPEISRRYGRLYNYLQDTEQTGGGLPTFELVLRLLCRNDAEWRSARLSLSAASPLVSYGIVALPAQFSAPFLTLPIKLTNPVVEYLLADQPQSQQLDDLLQVGFNLDAGIESAQGRNLSDWQLEQASGVAGYPQPAYLHLTIPETADLWSTLVLPSPLVLALRHLCDRLLYGKTVDQEWGFDQANSSPGSVVLFTGANGTGRTMAAEAIAQTLQAPLHHVDLAIIHAADSPLLLQEIATQTPKILLLKSAEVWFGCSAALSTATLHQFLHHRQQDYNLTILTTTQLELIDPKWHNYLAPILPFPIPDEPTRLKLWRQAFPAQVPLGKIQWSKLAPIELTGGEIQAIARDAAIMAKAGSSNSKVTMKHLLQALEIQGLGVKNGEF